MKKQLFLNCLIAGIFFTGISNAQTYTISTIAGNGTGGYNGDGIQATAASLYYPGGVIFDNTGGFYISDNFNDRVRKIDTATWIISTVAGDGTGGSLGDGGQATAAELNEQGGIRFDASGNLYIADRYSYEIRKVNTSGIISTVAGNGTVGFSGDGGQATAAQLNQVYDVLVDSIGQLYIADAGNSRVRMVNKAGVISTIAGGGSSLGDGGPATAAQLNSPNGLNFDKHGNLYISDGSAGRVRMVSPSGTITTVVGNGLGTYNGDGGPATAAGIIPKGIVLDAAGNMYITDNGNQRIRRVSGGIISTIAGNGTTGFTGDGGAATSAQIYSPALGVFDAAGNFYFADEFNHRIRKLTSTSLAGINEINSADNSVKVYPNPGKGEFIIQTSVISQKSFVEIYNMLGEKICTQFSDNTVATGTQFDINISSQGAGVYLYRIVSEKGASLGSGKLIIQ